MNYAFYIDLGDMTYEAWHAMLHSTRKSGETRRMVGTRACGQKRCE